MRPPQTRSVRPSLRPTTGAAHLGSVQTASRVGDQTTATSRRWIRAWIGAAALGVANGASREALYAEATGDEAAHVISTGTLLALLGGYISLLQRRWPLSTQREALSVGAAWAGMTVAFEFGFGHWVAGDSWSALLENYDVSTGKIWVLVPGAMACGPELARRLTRCEHPNPFP